MCLPVAALPALAIASGVVSGAGALYGGIQANNMGRYEAELAKRNAGMEIEAARESMEVGREEARNFWRKVGSVKGQQIAAMAANGIDVGYGSGGRIQDDTVMQSREDAANIYRNTNERKRGHLINAGNYVEQAKAAKARGKAALVGSVFNAAGSLMGGFSQAAGLRAKIAPGGDAGGSLDVSSTMDWYRGWLNGGS